MSAYKITISVTGISRILNALRNVNQNLYHETFLAMLQEMQGAVDESKQEAESRGWKLADQIRLGLIDPSNLTVEGGCFASYAGFPEFGTIKQHAQPFWRPHVWNHLFILLIRLNELERRLMNG